MIADYDPVGPWNNDAGPAVDEDALDTIEAGITAVTEEAQRLAGNPATPAAVTDFETTHRVGALNYVGSDAAFVAANEYIMSYYSAGIYYDGADWQNPGTWGGNGWTCLAFHASGRAYVYADTDTGATPRTYTEAQFLAKRIGEIPSSPATFFADGTNDGDIILWDAGAGAWVVGSLDVPVRPTDSKITTTTLGPSATGTIDGLNGEFSVAAADAPAVGHSIVLTVYGTFFNQTGSARTLTFTPKLDGVDLGPVAVSATNSASTRYWKAIVEILRTGADTARVVTTIHANLLTAVAGTTYGAGSSVSAINFAHAMPLLFNLNQTLSDADLQQSVTAARYEVV